MGRAGNENTSSGGLEHKEPVLYMSGGKTKPFPSTAEINGVFCTSHRWEERKISTKYSSFLCWALLQNQFETSKTVYVFSLCLLYSATIHTPKPSHNLDSEPLISAWKRVRIRQYKTCKEMLKSLNQKSIPTQPVWVKQIKICHQHVPDKSHVLFTRNL